jgi:NAD(P)-dependent dehydrogenase (short-subunit alcohol dehydrogenase family)
MTSTSKVAVVTGASSGIGKACALALAREGWSVVLAARRVDRLEETARQAGDAPTLLVETDVTKPEDIVNLFAKTKERFGRLDLLFNNAGMGGPRALLEDMSVEDWKRTVDTNLTGVFLCTQEAFKIMKDQDPRGGRIINNGSISAHAPRPNSIAYTATKHAVTGITKSSALDGRKYDIAVGQIDIGNAVSELSTPGRELPQPWGGSLKEAQMDVEDVAKAVVYMSSLSLDSNVQFMTVMATKMPFIGRG